MSRGEKRALVIGINEYPGWEGAADLDGCVNDARSIEHTLQSQFGFPESNVVTLVDGQATRTGILEALGDFAAETNQNDIVVLFYAGHGSTMTDREGDEPDGLDSTIVPYDSGRSEKWPNLDITDDEIYLWLLKVTKKTPYVTCIIDSCHSGTITRDSFGGKTRHVAGDHRSVDDLPESPPELQQLDWMKEASGGSGWLPVNDRYVLLSACRDSELANEWKSKDGVPHGAFTFFLTQAFARAKKGATYREVFDDYAGQILGQFREQSPQMEGTLDREVLGVETFEPMQFVSVASRDDLDVRLALGAAHGAEVGSLWSIYPAGTRGAGVAEPLGQIRVTSVDAVASWAEIVQESTAGTIMERCRAVRSAVEPSPSRMSVAVDPQGATLQELIVDSLLLTPAAAANADACIRFLPKRSSAGAPLPQLGAVSEDSWAVVGREGRLMTRLHAASVPDVDKLILENLELLASYRRALALENSDPTDPLRGRVDLEILKREGSGWTIASPDRRTGQLTFSEGNRIAARITNNSEIPVYCNLLDFGLSGKISQLYPSTKGAQEPLAPGNSIEVGVRPGDPKLKLYLPEQFPFVTGPDRPKATRGTEVFKLFVTSLETDFRPITQDGIRNADAASPPSFLGRVLAGAVGKRVMRDVAETVSPEPGHWTTTTRPFVLEETEGF